MQNENNLCVLMSFFKTNVSEEEIKYKIEEFKALAEAALLEVKALCIQRKDKIEAATYIGSGKVDELALICQEEEVGTLILNVELSGAQIKNLSELTGVSVIDRTALILDIFARRAKSSIAKLQVELAQYKYLLPRLKGYGSEMSNTGAGIGTRGLSEQKLELDRRKIHDKVHDYENRLKEAEKKRSVTKKSRKKSGIKTVSLLGYTNAGKSSLMNLFVEKYADDKDEKTVFVKDMLFATLETFHRRINLENNRSFVLADTVGFVSDLPHSLVKAFSSTLEEVVEADLILHIVDLSNEEYLNQMMTSENILDELTTSKKNRLLVFNKFDLIKEKETIDERILRFLRQVNFNYECYFISCKTGEGFEQLKKEIEKRLFGQIIEIELIIPFSEGNIVQELIDISDIIDTKYNEIGTLLKIRIAKNKCYKYTKYITS